MTTNINKKGNKDCNDPIVLFFNCYYSLIEAVMYNDSTPALVLV